MSVHAFSLEGVLFEISDDWNLTKNFDFEATEVTEQHHTSIKNHRKIYTFYSTNDIYIILPLLDINFFIVLLIGSRGSIIIFCKQAKD